MTVIAFNSEVSKGQLKHYADAICFSQVGLSDAEVAAHLCLPEHLVTAWVCNWRTVEAQARAA